MKIYNKIVFDAGGNVVEEDSFEYHGDIAECKGPSGAVSFPAYMEYFHKYVLANNATGDPSALGTSYVEVAAALISGASPYDGENAYDPDTVLDTNDTRYSAYDTLVVALSAQADWNSALSNAATKADDLTLFPKVNLLDDDLKTDAITDAVAAAAVAQSASGVSDQVSAFDVRGKEALARARNRFLTGAAINKTMHSAMIIGMALLERAHLDTVNEYSANLGKSTFDNSLAMILGGQIEAGKRRREFRNQVVASGSQFVVEKRHEDVKQSAQSLSLLIDKNKIRVVASQEEKDRNLEIDIAEAHYDLDVLDRLMSALAAINGAPSVTNSKVSRTQSTLGGLAAGASAGSAFGPVGMGVGAVVGGLAGYFGGK